MNRLKRFTELPFLIEYLITGQLALLNPAKWEDGLDRQRLENYRSVGGFKSVYAYCLAECPETFHHWKIYSKGLNGVCIEFDKNELIESLDSDKCKYGPVKYLDWKDLEHEAVPISDKPFLKRNVFSDEQEFRIIATLPLDQQPVLFQSVPITAVRKIILNPWMPASTASAIFTALKRLPGCDAPFLCRSQMLGPT